MDGDCEICQGTGEVDLQVCGEDITTGCPACIEREKGEEVAGLKAENARLREHIAKYGWHLDDCTALATSVDADCDCGLFE